MIETVQPEFLAVGILVGMGAFLIKCSFSATNSYQVVKAGIGVLFFIAAIIMLISC